MSFKTQYIQVAIYNYIAFIEFQKELYTMDKENLLSQQVNSIPSDALNTPSKEQEQLLETSSQNVQNSNNNTNKKMLLKVYLEKIPLFQ